MKGTLSYATASFSERLFTFFLLPILTKLVTPTEFAVWSQSIIVVGILTPIILLKFDTSVIKFFPTWKNQNKKKNSIIFFMLTIIFILFCILSTTALVFDQEFAHLIFGNNQLSFYIPLIIFLLLSELLFEFLISILRITNRVNKVSIYILMKGAWRLACISIVLIGIDGNFYLAFYTFILFQLIATIGLFIWDINPVSIISAGYKKSRSDWKKILNFSLPLVPFIMLMALNNFIDRFFITHYHGLDALAPYIAGFSLAVVITFFYSTISFTLFPELSNKWTNRNKFQIASLIKKVVIAYLALTIPFLTFLGIAGTEVLVALTTVDYFISPQILFLISFNVALYGFYQITYFLVLLGRGSANAPLIMLFVTGINILFNFLLVPEFGILGSALSGFISNSLLSIIAYKMSLDVLKWIFPFKEILIILMRSFIFGIVFFLGMIWFGKDIVSLISNLIIAGIIYSLLDFFDNKSSSFFNIIKIRNYKLNIFKFIKNNTE